MRTLRLPIVLAALVLAAAGPLAAAEYFVSLDGSDANDGLSRETAFATIQRGVDALEPGDTLTIGPGEYRESVARANLGSMDAETVIRAEIPGTAVLRGDIPSPRFEPLAGHRFVYYAEVDHEDEIQTVNELDTLTIFQSKPNIPELEFSPGTFHHDMDEGRLYISTSDGLRPETHRYSLSIVAGNGLALSNPRRVVVEGLAATGFNTARYVNIIDGSAGIGHGIMLDDASECVIRDCRVWLNGFGILVRSQRQDAGANVIERCVAWANDSPFASWRKGGISAQRHRGDVIRECVAFLNAYCGLYLRSDADREKTSRVLNSLSWGNGYDVIIKGNPDYANATERTVSGSSYSRRKNAEHSLFLPTQGRTRGEGEAPGTIVLSEEQDLDMHREFADPDNHDYRLQATSRFRGTGPDGGDRGPFPYEANVFFVLPDGDDTADGLSVENAWRTVARGVRGLRPGDTLYLGPGVYREDVDARLQGAEGEPISIRGRGLDPVVLAGDVRLAQSQDVEFNRLSFQGAVAVDDSNTVAFEQCVFAGTGAALTANGATGLKVSHCRFAGFQEAALALRDSAQVHLSGNLYDNRYGVAVRAEHAGAIRYSDYNAYRDPAASWEVAGAAMALGEVGNGWERYSRAFPEGLGDDEDDIAAEARPLLATAGPMGNAFGPYRHAVRREPLRLTAGPDVHSVTATTANVEWWASRPAVFRVHWGETPELGNSRTLSRVPAYHPTNPLQHFSTFSLNGLEPDTQYYVKVEFVELVGDGDDQDLVEFDEELISFTTEPSDPEPRTLHVSPHGDNSLSGTNPENAWRTINHAADQVRPGDTVLIGEGVYPEKVRIRVTGEQGAPITFMAKPGEKVVLDGAGKQLQSAFLVFHNKDYLRFDGLYTRDFARDRTQLGAFALIHSNNIRITRCFHDGRSAGNDPVLVTAGYVDDLLVRNCVTLRGWDSMGLHRSTNVRIENNVFVQPSIRAIPGSVTDREDVQIKNNILTDSLAKKRNVFLVSQAMTLENNCFWLRFPEEERSVFGGGSEGRRLDAYNEEHGVQDENFVANPRFAALGWDENEHPSEGYYDAAILQEGDDFPDFFVAHPELIERGIGLIPEDFEDFHFNR